MSPALKFLSREGIPTAQAIDDFIHQNRFPLVEPGRVTFVYRGQVEKVFLRSWISGLNTAQPLERLKGTDLWALTIELPDMSRFEYKFEVYNHGNSELELDKLNDVLAHDPYGANSVCQGYGYKRPGWTLPDPESRSGELTTLRIESRSFREIREVEIYLPALFRRSRSYPLLVVHDGLDYLRYADFKIVLDNLIHRLEIPAMIVAMTQSPNRLTEYTGDYRHARYLGDDLLPGIAAKFPLVDDRKARGLLGASLGGVACLHAASRYPALFGNLLLQSGSFAFSDLGHHNKDPVFDPVVRFVNEYRSNPFVLAEKIYMSCGIYESLIYENRSMQPIFQDLPMQIMFEEARDAHNWENWRDRLRHGLSWLFPGPLWMVYE